MINRDKNLIVDNLETILNFSKPKKYQGYKGEIICGYFIVYCYNRSYFATYLYFDRIDYYEYFQDNFLNASECFANEKGFRKSFRTLRFVFDDISNVINEEVDTLKLENFYKLEKLKIPKLTKTIKFNENINEPLLNICSIMINQSLKSIEKYIFDILDNKVLTVYGNVNIIKKMKKYIKKKEFFLFGILPKARDDYDIVFDEHYFLFKLFFANDFQFRKYNISDIRSAFLYSLSDMVSKVFNHTFISENNYGEKLFDHISFKYNFIKSINKID